MSHKSVSRSRLILRAVLVLLILGGSGVTVLNLMGFGEPNEPAAGLVITLHEQPKRGYGAADVELNGQRYALQSGAELADALQQGLSARSNPVCLLRVAAGVSQKSIYQLQEMLNMDGGGDWSFHIVLLDQRSE